MLSAAPRNWATSSGGRSRAGLGNLTRLPERPGGSGPKPTLTSSCSAIARSVEAVARLKISVGENACVMLQLTRRPILVIPATAGIQGGQAVARPGPRFRGGDE